MRVGRARGRRRVVFRLVLSLKLWDAVISEKENVNRFRADERHCK